MASLNDQKVLAFMFDPFLLDAMNNEEDKSANGSTSESGKCVVLKNNFQIITSFTRTD